MRRSARVVLTRDGDVRAQVGFGLSVGSEIALGGVAILVDLECVDAPVRLLECGWVLANKVVAGAGFGGAAAGGPGGAGPVAAESDIEHLNHN